MAATLLVGVAAFVAQLMYLWQVPPLRADTGIIVSGALLVCWAALVLAVFVTKGWRAWWVLAVTSPALIGPGLFVGLVVGCAIDQGACP